MSTYYKSALSVRGDSLYCPLSFSLDSYWNCLADCWHCSFRSLNHTWGTDLRPANPEQIKRKLMNGLKNKAPKTSLAYCLKLKKTIRFGSRSDPFQDAEDEYGVSGEILKILIKLNWSFVIQTRFPSRLLKYRKLLFSKKSLWIMIPVMSPGGDQDWEVLERSRTDHPNKRLQIAKQFIKRGIHVGFNGEPFIPGYHEVKDFEDIIKRLKSYGIPSYNTYNFHFNPFVAKRLHAIGIDIERIWYYNQDQEWKKILQKLIDVAKRYHIQLGCPDFVNTGWKYRELTNTCCGVNVPNPTTFNTHMWKRMIQEGRMKEEILKLTWDEIGDYKQGKQVLMGKDSKNFYTIHDIIK